MFREIVEEDEFLRELGKLIPDQKEADELMFGTKTLLSAFAEDYPTIPDTNVQYIIGSDAPSGRFLVIYYTIIRAKVHLLSMRHFVYS